MGAVTVVLSASRVHLIPVIALRRAARLVGDVYAFPVRRAGLTGTASFLGLRVALERIARLVVAVGVAVAEFIVVRGIAISVEGHVTDAVATTRLGRIPRTMSKHEIESPFSNAISSTKQVSLQVDESQLVSLRSTEASKH